MNGYQRVLFISPSGTGLDVTPEIDSLSELGYTARALQGTVTAQRIFDATRRAQWDVLHFACHATPEGDALFLSDQEPFNTDALLQVARMCNAKLVFLNACNTAQIGQVLVDEHVPSVITTLIRVEDALAKQTAQTFYQSLARSNNAHDAFRAARPASRGVYQFLSNGSYQEMLMEPIIKRLDALSSLVTINEEDHVQMRADMDRMCNQANSQRIWFLRVTVGSVVSMAVVTVILMLVLR